MTVACPFCGSDTDFLQAKAVARLLGLSPRTIRTYLKQGRFPGSVKMTYGPGKSEWKIPTSAVLPLIGGDSDYV